MQVTLDIRLLVVLSVSLFCPRSEILKLEQNFRSTSNIVNAGKCFAL